MSGWIKLEKDLLTDPRLLKMAQQLSKACECNGRPLPGVMVVLGGLAQIWMIADTHVGDDDILPLGIDQINHILGMQGFCEILPQDWLQVIDADHVKLPGFHEHNGTVAKSRALNQRRVEIHRSKRNGKPLHVSNGQALPDLDLDLDSKKKNKQKKIASRIPQDFALTADLSDYAKGRGLDPLETFEAFRDYWIADNTPKATKRDWVAAWRTWVRSPFNQPKPNGATRPAQPKPSNSAEWAELRAHAQALGFRAPGELESIGAYRTDLRQFETTPAKFRPRVLA
jgi:hypothetical protein